MRSSKAVVRVRVEAVMKLRLLGAEFHDLRQFASEDDPETGRPWNVSERTLWRYLADADKLLDHYLEKDKQKLLNRHIGMRRSLYARAVERGDERTALLIAKDEAELLGLYPDRANGQGSRNVSVNVFQAIGERDQQLRVIGTDALDGDLQSGDVQGDRPGQPLDTQPAHAQADGVSACG